MARREETKGAGPLGGVAVAVLAVACCAGLPLLLVAGASVGLAAVIGGLTVAGIALAVAIALIALRAQRRRARARRVPAPGTTRLHSPE